jgi:hypothetical protein
MKRTKRPQSRCVSAARRVARVTALAGAAALGVSALATSAHAAGAPGHPDIAVQTLGYPFTYVSEGFAFAQVNVNNVGQETAINPIVHIRSTPGTYSSVTFDGPEEAGQCTQSGDGVDCMLGSLEPGDRNGVLVKYLDITPGTLNIKAEGDPVLGEVNLTNNLASLQTKIFAAPTTTTATAVATVRAGQPFVIHAEVAAGNGYVASSPSGTVTVTGPDGVAAAPLSQKAAGIGVANATLISTHRGVNTFAVSYPDSSLLSGSTTTVKVLVF